MPPPEDLAAHLQHLEEQLLRPGVRGDPSSLDWLLAPDFTEFGSSGRIFDRDAIIAALASEAPFPAPPPQIEDLKIVAATDDLAIVTYRITGRRASLRSSVWVRREGRWQMRFHQGTREPA